MEEKFELVKAEKSVRPSKSHGGGGGGGGGGGEVFLKSREALSN